METKSGLHFREYIILYATEERKRLLINQKGKENDVVRFTPPNIILYKLSRISFPNTYFPIGIKRNIQEKYGIT